MYQNEKKALKEIQDKQKPDELSNKLMKAQAYYESIEHLRHSEKLQLANIYSEVSNYKKDEIKQMYIEKAEKKYLEVIKETEKENESEKKSFRFVEVSFRYFNFLKFQRRFEDEMELLNTVSSTPLKDDFGDIRFIRQSQERLLIHCQNRDIMKGESKAHELQSVIQFDRGNIHSAIFYIWEAINDESSKKESYKERLGDYLLNASRAESPIYFRGTKQEYLNEAL